MGRGRRPAEEVEKEMRAMADECLNEYRAPVLELISSMELTAPQIANRMAGSNEESPEWSKAHWCVWKLLEMGEVRFDEVTKRFYLWRQPSQTTAEQLLKEGSPPGTQKVTRRRLPSKSSNVSR